MPHSSDKNFKLRHYPTVSSSVTATPAKESHHWRLSTWRRSDRIVLDLDSFNFSRSFTFEVLAGPI